MAECGLELNLDKTRIVYWQDDNRRQSYPNTSFDFLGYIASRSYARDEGGPLVSVV